MIDVIEAAAQARRYAQQMIGQHEFSLEEVERDTYKGRDAWILTLGYTKPPAPSLAARAASSFADLEDMLRLRGDRAYKTFLVDAESGEVLAMKLRDVTASCPCSSSFATQASASVCCWTRTY